MALEGLVQITVFPDKATVWILAFIYDENGSLANSTAVKINISDPDNTLVVDEEEMTNYEGTTGVYEYYYHEGDSADPMDAGEWTGEILAIDGSGDEAKISPKSFAFTVI